MFRILGDYSNCKTGLLIDYFKERDIFLDCRGIIEIANKVIMGFNITILTYSHDINRLEIAIPRKVIIHDAFIGSNVLIYNSEIGSNSIIACGSVVRNMYVEPNTMVEGNPAKVIAHRIDKIWRYDKPKEVKREHIPKD